MDSEQFRRARVPAAWILIAAAAVEVLIGVWTLSGLPGSPATGSGLPPFGQVPFLMRAEEAMPSLLNFTVSVLPVAAVLLVAAGRRPAGPTRSVTWAAVAIQAVALVSGVLAWGTTVGQTTYWGQISSAVEIAVVVAALILTYAILQSQTADQQTQSRANAGQR